MKRYWALKAGKMFVLFAAFVLVAGLGVMLLWNALIPTIFGATPITWLQALGLLILARILVGGRGPRGWGGHRGEHWRKRWEAKTANMGPAERAKFEEELGRFSCFGRGTASDERAETGPVEAQTQP